MKSVQIDALHPTQATQGQREVREKMDAYRALSGHDLEMAIADKPVPIVYGPHCAAYAVDHHHVATALWQAGVRSVPVVLMADLSSMTAGEFWLTLENHRWTHPYDVQGRRVPFGAMPARLWDLVDDEYRSLAAAVRDAGGYDKTAVPLAEFRWADLLRSALPYPSTDAEYGALIKRACKLARSRVALGLPGYIGEQG